jgi:hypothetical protein
MDGTTKDDYLLLVAMGTTRYFIEWVGIHCIWDWRAAVMLCVAEGAFLSLSSDDLLMEGTSGESPTYDDAFRKEVLEICDIERHVDALESSVENRSHEISNFAVGARLLCIFRSLNIGPAKVVLAATLADHETERDDLAARISSLETENMALSSEIDVLVEQLRDCMVGLETEKERLVAAAVQSSLVELLGEVDDADDDNDDDDYTERVDGMGDSDDDDAEVDYIDDLTAFKGLHPPPVAPRTASKRPPKITQPTPVTKQKPVPKPRKPETARVREGRALRAALTEIYRLERQGKMKEASSKLAALDGSQGDAPESDSIPTAPDARLDDLACMRARELRDQLFRVGRFDLTRRTVMHFLQAPDMQRILPSHLTECGKDAKLKAEVFKAARAMLSDQDLLGSERHFGQPR